MHGSRPVGTNGREEVLRSKAVGDIVELLAVASEEDGSAARPVAHANDVTLDIGRSVGSWGEGLVVSSVAGRLVRNRRLVEACTQSAHPYVYICISAEKSRERTRQSEERVGLGRHADADESRLWLVVDLRLPVVDVILLWDRQVALDATLGVEELDLGASLDKAVGNLEFWLKLPCGNAFFLDRKELGERYIRLHRLGGVCLDEGCP